MAVQSHPTYLHQSLRSPLRRPIVPLVGDYHQKDRCYLYFLNHVDHNLLIVNIASKVQDNAHEKVSQFSKLSRVELRFHQESQELAHYLVHLVVSH